MPLHHSGFGLDEDKRYQFLVGARLYGLELVLPEHEEEFLAANPGRFTLKPQQLQVVDTLAKELDDYVFEIPRRASKTTTIFCYLLGRCAVLPGHQVTFSAQSGVKGGARLREWKTRLDLINPVEEFNPYARRIRRKPAPQALALFGEDPAPAPEEPADRGFKILMGEVGKGIYFDNGSQFLVLKPEAGAYRGEAADESWIDEAQEVDVDDGAELLAGIVPLQDTKPGSCLILSGTAAEARVGILWDALKRLRDKDEDAGGMDFAVPEDTVWALVENEESAMNLVLSMHPGIGTLTTLEKMRKNWRKMQKPQWAREYLSMWPVTYGEREITPELWESAGLARKKARPARVAFAFDIKPGGSSSAIAAAWRDARGVAYIEIIEHRQGTGYIPERTQYLTRKYRGSDMAYDDIGEGRATVTAMATLKPKPKTRVQSYRDIAVGCVQIVRDLRDGTVRHFNQAPLDVAVEGATKREVYGDKGVWLWGGTGDITPLVAATKALRNWDQWHAKRAAAAEDRPGILTSDD